jgi:hypothetical protein
MVEDLRAQLDNIPSTIINEISSRVGQLEETLSNKTLSNTTLSNKQLLNKTLADKTLVESPKISLKFAGKITKRNVEDLEVLLQELLDAKVRHNSLSTILDRERYNSASIHGRILMLLRS